MAKEGEEVLKEFVRRVNAMLERLQKAARVGEGPMNQADLDVLAVASVELLTNTLANMPEPLIAFWTPVTAFALTAAMLFFRYLGSAAET